MSRLDRIIERLSLAEGVTPADMDWLCARVEVMLALEDNIVTVRSPVTIVGDIHGQFRDMLEIFREVGLPPKNRFLFLGDLVDRGHDSISVVAMVLALKARFPDCITVIRGNHETRQLNQSYGFYDECRMRKFNWQTIVSLFDNLPLAAIVDGRAFCVHGGLSESARTIDQIRALRRRQELPMEGALSELLWSDPNPLKAGFCKSDRGAGVYYGEDTVMEFLERNSLDIIVRSHQLVMEGFERLFHDKLITVWSAPNYTYRCGNFGAVLKLSPNLVQEVSVFSKSKQQETEERQYRLMLEHFQ